MRVIRLVILACDMRMIEVRVCMCVCVCEGERHIEVFDGYDLLMRMTRVIQVCDMTPVIVR